MASASFLPQRVIVRICKEVRDLNSRPPDGVRPISSEEDSVGEILAVIEGPVGTPFEGGSFTVKLVLGDDYPTSPPKGFFMTQIYHPNVMISGDICVNTLKRDWNSTVTISHIFQVIRCLLIVPFPESSLNDEAGKLFMDNYDEYFRRARLMTSIHARSSSSSTPSSLSVANMPDIPSQLSTLSDENPTVRKQLRDESEETDSLGPPLNRRRSEEDDVGLAIDGDKVQINLVSNVENSFNLPIAGSSSSSSSSSLQPIIAVSSLVSSSSSKAVKSKASMRRL